ncbi:MAG: tRNA (adenosine(37)-N6)-dimethylallyltransferase MiaA [Elusimicrobia bacterium RIFOXYB2_FULL_49_7]|nr:MAG: tRNA (adenosine(37)-N6)-dimethylallyltransferase MiaA [Elusimicrobia bacterium RIFOXYB2_FULL_49_7]
MSLIDKPEIAVLCGPTASGKSELAMAWAERLNGEIVSVDSVQIYRSMDIGTAKPSFAMRQAIPHHLIDIVEPRDRFDAADFAIYAQDAISDIVARQKMPILCGGAGLYFKALFEGFFESPKPDLTVRAKWMQRASKEGAEAVYHWLVEHDPESAAQIHPNNVKRVVRAIEVFEATGQKMSLLKVTGKKQDRFIVRDSLFLNPPREELYSRIDRRTEKMFQDGLVEEVDRLLKQYPENSPAFQAIGYKESIELIHGKRTLEEAMTQVKRNTRHYAKRQITWFKNQKILGMV